jgi:hypothetical protein
VVKQGTRSELPWRAVVEPLDVAWSARPALELVAVDAETVEVCAALAVRQVAFLNEDVAKEALTANFSIDVAGGATFAVFLACGAPVRQSVVKH